MSQHILITGGAGFIGTHLARMAVAAGHKVRLLDNLSPQIHCDTPDYTPPEGTEFLRGDVTVREDLEAALKGVDSIVHLAAETGTGQSMYEIDRYYRVNVQGTALLFDILANQDHGVSSVILASSRSIYGEGAYRCPACGDDQRFTPPPRSAEQLSNHVWEPRCPSCDAPAEMLPTREDDAMAPASVYAATKLAQEEVVRVAGSALGLRRAILRFQNVYGEGQSLSNPYTGILSIFSTRIRLGLGLPIFEDGEETRDFVHVEDVARAVLACVESDKEDILVNVGSGKATSVMEVAKLLVSVMGSDIEPHVTAQYRVGDIRHNVADLGALKAATGLTPSIGLETGMKRFCDWVRTQPVPQDMLDKANAELKARNLMG